MATRHADRVLSLTSMSSAPDHFMRWDRRKISAVARFAAAHWKKPTGPDASGEQLVRVYRIAGSTGYPHDENWSEPDRRLPTPSREHDSSPIQEWATTCPENCGPPSSTKSTRSPRTTGSADTKLTLPTLSRSSVLSESSDSAARDVSQRPRVSMISAFGRVARVGPAMRSLLPRTPLPMTNSGDPATTGSIRSAQSAGRPSGVMPP
jgi:hypothetical protein